MGVVGRGHTRETCRSARPMHPTMIVDVGDHGLGPAVGHRHRKIALAMRRICLACRSSRSPPSSPLSVLGPVGRDGGRCPLSTSALSADSCSLCGVQPIWPQSTSLPPYAKGGSLARSRPREPLRSGLSPRSSWPPLRIWSLWHPGDGSKAVRQTF